MNCVKYLFIIALPSIDMSFLLFLRSNIKGKRYPLLDACDVLRETLLYDICPQNIDWINLILCKVNKKKIELKIVSAPFGIWWKWLVYTGATAQTPRLIHGKVEDECILCLFWFCGRLHRNDGFIIIFIFIIYGTIWSIVWVHTFYVVCVESAYVNMYWSWFLFYSVDCPNEIYWFKRQLI